MNAEIMLDRPYQPLVDWLAAQGIDYEIHQHDRAFTARATAAAEGVDPQTFAKVVAVASDEGRTALVVLDATDQLDLRKARHVLGASDVRLLTEPQLTALAPDCEVGAIPAVGTLFGLTTYADYAVRDHPEISFNAGSHRSAPAWIERAGSARALSSTPTWQRTPTMDRHGHAHEHRSRTTITQPPSSGSMRSEAIIVRMHRDRTVSNAWNRRCRLITGPQVTSGTIPPSVTAAGSPQSAGEPHRIEHLNQFVQEASRTGWPRTTTC